MGITLFRNKVQQTLRIYAITCFTNGVFAIARDQGELPAKTQKMRSPVEETFIYVGSEMFPLVRRVTRYSQSRKCGNVRSPVYIANSFR